MISQFIQVASTELGLTSSEAQQATGAAAQLLKSKASASDFSLLAQAVPGLADLGNDAGDAGPAAGGLGSLLGGLAGSLGGDANLLGSLAGLADSGLSMDKMGPFVQLLLSFLKEKAGDEVVTRIVGAIPELGDLIS